MPQYVYQQTLQYVTFIKRALVESLQAAFNNHPDLTVRNSKVGIDFRKDRWKAPGVIIKYYERELINAGVGHFEYIVSEKETNLMHPTRYLKFYHRFYKGDIAFDIYGESSVDRDLLRDALIEVLAMTDVTTGGSNFINRLYYSIGNTPYGLWHFPVLNLDRITGYGEQTMIAPWQPEDLLVYQASYRVPIFGEFYSSPDTAPEHGVVTEVDVYPWIGDYGIQPPPSENPYYPGNPAWLRFTGWPEGQVVLEADMPPMVPASVYEEWLEYMGALDPDEDDTGEDDEADDDDDDVIEQFG